MYKRIGFKMKLNPGMVEEYKKRHDGLWPELNKLLKDDYRGIVITMIQMPVFRNTAFF